MTKIKTVKRIEDAKASITKFRSELDDSLELQANLGYARAWYALPEEHGVWAFAPSKFAGYNGMTSELYLNNYQAMDGRDTERVLSEWFTVVDESHPLYAELSAELRVFLEWYEKSPSTAARICIPNDLYERSLMNDDDLRERQIADLIIAVTRSLSGLERKRIFSKI